MAVFSYLASVTYMIIYSEFNIYIFICNK